MMLCDVLRYIKAEHRTHKDPPPPKSGIHTSEPETLRDLIKRKEKVAKTKPTSNMGEDMFWDCF